MARNLRRRLPVAPPPGGPPPMLPPPPLRPRRPCVMGGCGDLSEAVTAAARARAGLPLRPEDRHGPVPPLRRPGLPPALPHHPPGFAPRPPAGRPRPARPPKLAGKVHRLPPGELHKLAGKREAHYDRLHRDRQAKLHKIHEMIEKRKVPAAKLAKAEAMRRKLGAQTVAAYLRRRRTRISQMLAALAAKARGDEAERLRRASAYVLTMPIDVSAGKARALCAGGDGAVSGLGDLGLPGGAYTGQEVVEQYSMWPIEWQSPAAGLRAGILAATGMAPALAERPVGVTVPADVQIPLPPSVAAAQPRLPDFRLATQTMPPKTARMVLPPPIPHCGPPSIIGAARHPGHRPVMPLPPGAPATGSAVTGASLGGLGEDIVLADVAGDYSETVLAADLGYTDGLGDMLGFEGLDGLADAEFGKLQIKWPWHLRLKAHKVKMGRVVAAGLLGGALTAVGMPIAGGVAAGSVLSKAFEQEAQATADEEEETAKVLKLPIKVGAKSRRMAKLRLQLAKEAAAVRCA